MGRRREGGGGGGVKGSFLRKTLNGLRRVCILARVFVKQKCKITEHCGFSNFDGVECGRELIKLFMRRSMAKLGRLKCYTTIQCNRIGYNV